MSTPEVQIAFFTGRSNRASCELSASQAAFLERLGGAGRRLEPLNFPYDTTKRAYEPAGLIRASLSNALDYITSRRKAFRVRYRPSVEALLSRAPSTVFLMGSCGLELFCNLRLDPDHLARTYVFALGPVARTLPACRCVVLQGYQDWISRLFVRGAHYQVNSHHLGYLMQEEVFRHCESVVTEAAAASRTLPPAHS